MRRLQPLHHLRHLAGARCAYPVWPCGKRPATRGRILGQAAPRPGPHTRTHASTHMHARKHAHARTCTHTRTDEIADLLQRPEGPLHPPISKIDELTPPPGPVPPRPTRTQLSCRYGPDDYICAAIDLYLVSPRDSSCPCHSCVVERKCVTQIAYLGPMPQPPINGGRTSLASPSTPSLGAIELGAQLQA